MGCSHLVLRAEKKPDFWKCTSSHICDESHPTAASKISAIPRIKQKKKGKNEEREKEREREGEGEERQTHLQHPAGQNPGGAVIARLFFPPLKRREESLHGDMKHFREKQTNIGFFGESET